MNNSSIGEMLTAPLLFGFGNIYAPLKKTDDGIAEPVYIGLNGIYTFKIHNASSFARVFGKRSIASPDFLRKKTVPIINAVSSEVLQNYLKSHEVLQSKISESFPSLEEEILNALSENEKLKAAEVDVCSIKIDGVTVRETYEILPITMEKQRKKSLMIKIASVVSAVLLVAIGSVLFVQDKNQSRDKDFLKDYVESEKLSLYMYDKEIDGEFGDGGVFQIVAYYDGEVIHDYEKLSIEVSDEEVGSALSLTEGRIILIPRKNGSCYIKISYLGETLIRKWHAFPNWQLFSPLQLYKETSYVQDGFQFGSGGPNYFTGFVIYRGVLVKDMENLKITVADESLGIVEKYDDGRLLFRQFLTGETEVVFEYKGEIIHTTWRAYTPVEPEE